MNFRRLLPSDAAQYQGLRLEGLLELPTAFASSYEEERAFPLEKVAERLSGEGGSAVFGALEGTELLGTTGLYCEPKPKLAHKGMLWGVYVTPAARRQGLARELVSMALKHAADECKLRQVNLGVNATNTAATALYRELGFEDYGFESGFMLVDGVLQDERLMVCFLRDR